MFFTERSPVVPDVLKNLILEKDRVPAKLVLTDYPCIDPFPEGRLAYLEQISHILTVEYLLFQILQNQFIHFVTKCTNSFILDNYVCLVNNYSYFFGQEICVTSCVTKISLPK